MRWLALAGLLAAAHARADVSLPARRGGGAGAADCGAIFDDARREAAAQDPRFATIAIEHAGPGRWDLTLRRAGGVFATVSVFPLPVDSDAGWFALGEDQPAYVRWSDRREGFVLVSGFSPAVERQLRALFQSAADRCLAR